MHTTRLVSLNVVLTFDYKFKDKMALNLHKSLWVHVVSAGIDYKVLIKYFV